MSRVLMLITSDQRRGAETFATSLANHLNNLGHSTNVLAISPSPSEAKVPTEVAGSRRWDLRGLYRISRASLDHDLIVGHGSSTLIHGSVVSKLAGKPFIYRSIGDPSVWGQVTAANLRIGLPLRSAAAVAALYPAARDELVRRYRLDPSSVRVIPNAVTERVHATDLGAPRVRPNFDLDPELRWVAFVGALSPEKRPELAIRAVAVDDSLGLLVAGDGPEAERCRSLARELAPNRIKFLGATDGSTDVLDAVEALVITSRTEGMPGVSIEAGLAALPVVAPPVGGIPEVVIDGETGVLVRDPTPQSFAAGLRHALVHQEALGTAAQRRCRERFTMTRVAAQWAELIKATLDRPTSTR